MTQSILIIIPAYNEAGSIENTIGEIQRNSLKADILVVDDGSSDDTSSRAGSCGAKVITLPFNLGIGGAVQTGFQYAVRCGYQAAARVDGDGQHDTGFLEPLLAPVIRGEADVVTGSRFLGHDEGYRSSFIRRVGIHFFAGLISGLLQSRITDPTSGFQAYSRRALLAFAENYPSDFPEPESIVAARRLGLRFTEVPVRMRRRRAGHTSIRYFLTLYYMVKVTFAILLNMIKKN